jgi:hypothetical protein
LENGRRRGRSGWVVIKTVGWERLTGASLGPLPIQQAGIVPERHALGPTHSERPALGPTHSTNPRF